MDKKKIWKHEVEYRRPKDRGDNVRRVLKIPKNKVDNETQVERENLCDRGDIAKKTEPFLRPEDALRKSAPKSKYMFTYTNNGYRDRLSENALRKIQEKKDKHIQPLDIDRRRKLNQMYTFRRPTEDSNVSTLLSSVVKGYKTGRQVSLEPKRLAQVPRKPTCEVITMHHVSPIRPETRDSEVIQMEADSNAEVLQSIIKEKSAPRRKRKPIIKTLTHKGDSTKIYKAVSFVDQQRKATPLRINMAHKSPATASSHSQKSKQKSTDSRASTVTPIHHTRQLKKHNSPSSIKKLVMNRSHKTKTRRRRNSSPELVVQPPPLTEVAKWAPQSVDEHTKPYYEAWVNTTLTAISNDNDRIRKEKQKIMRLMEERLQYQSIFGLSEEELSDEKYAGRIKVTRR